MHITKRSYISVLCLTTVLAGSTFGQGLSWESTTRSGSSGEKGTASKMYAIPKKFKMVNESMTLILRMDKEVIYTLDPEKKTYTERSFADLENLSKNAAGRRDAAMAKMRERMKDMTPEGRKQMEKFGALANAGSTSPVEVSETSEKKSVSGYSCTKYLLKRDGKEMTALWITRDVSGFENIKQDWVEFSKRMAGMSGRSGLSGLSEAYMKIDGFPMETDMMLGETPMVTTVTRMEKTSTPSSEFDVPSGYVRIQSPENAGAKQ